MRIASDNAGCETWHAAAKLGDVAQASFLGGFAVVLFQARGAFSSVLVALPFLLIPIGFVVYGLGLALRVPIRQRFRTGGSELLTIDADGIDMRGMGRLRWSEIDDVRAVDSGLPTGEGSPSIRRLEIVPRDPRRFGDRPRAERWYDAYRSFLRRLKPFGDRSPIERSFGLDMDLLDESSDEVLDLIARYRVVDDQT